MLLLKYDDDDERWITIYVLIIEKICYLVSFLLFLENVYHGVTPVMIRYNLLGNWLEQASYGFCILN
uniref:Uncharacterized protein n=1 Tax=Tanacetum cinerariifolium TaxID=118510 RepID=A0A6L2NM43_TANCI|nr:hypothetical protein [Tanacetum cinerariifolium]